MGKPFILTTDASSTGIGYILSQKDEEKESVISYGGRVLRDAETRYSASEREMLAVKEGIKAFCPYLSDHRFTLITDHQPLKYYHKFQPATKRLCDMALYLQGYQFEVVYKEGKSNCNADSISRIPYERLSQPIGVETKPPEEKKISDKDIHIVDTYPAGSRLTAATTKGEVCICSLDPANMATLQEQCPEVGFLYKFHHKGVIPNDPNQANTCFRTQDQYVVDNNVLYHVYFQGNRKKPEHMIKQVVVPKGERRSLLESYHDDMVGGGHQGLDRTYSHLLMKYFWSGMYSDVSRYIVTCDVCQRVKHHRARPPPLTPMPVVGIFKRWHVDFLSLKLTPDGYKYVLLFVDSASKWCEAFPTKNQEAETVAKLLYENIISRFGCPDELLSDLGRQFTSKVLRAMCELYSIKQTFTSPYHPQTNAACERLNSFIIQSIRAYNTKDQNNWPKLIPAIMMAYRCTPAVKSTELSPFQTLFGENMQIPADADLLPKKTLPAKLQNYLQDRMFDIKVFRETAQHNIKRHQQDYKASHDMHKNAVDPQLVEGQMVLMSDEAVPLGHTPKLHPPFKGPYIIVSCGPNYTYLLDDVNGKRLPHAINGRRLKPFMSRDVESLGNPPVDGTPPQTPATHDDDQLEGVAQLMHDAQPSDSVPRDTGEPQPSTSATQHPIQNATPKRRLTKDSEEQHGAPQHPRVTTQTSNDMIDNTGEKQRASQQLNVAPKGNPTIHPDMVEDILKITNNNGIKYYRVKLKAGQGRTWVFRESVPDKLVHNFHKQKTMTGRTRKRGKKSFLVLADTQ